MKKVYCIVFVMLTMLIFSSCSNKNIDIQKNENSNIETMEAIGNLVQNKYIPHEIIDSHLHYFNFVSETDGFDKLIKKMNESGVSKSVIFGTPIVKSWDEDTRPVYYWDTDSSAYYYSATDFIMFEELEKQPKEVQNRFYPFVCGINPHDRNSVEHIKKVVELHPNMVAGIGEIMSKHDDLTAYTYGEPPKADDKAMLLVYDYAAEQGLPILIHHNIASSYTNELTYIDEMKNALAYNRNVNFIWAHIGISRRVEVVDLIETAKMLLDENSNLYFDLSWLVYDNYININDKSLNDWATVIEQYPNRFMIGTDLIGRYDNYFETISKYGSLVSRLSDEVAENVCSKNILALVKKY